MDVDGPALQLAAEVVRQHLHVAGQHDQFGAFLLDDLVLACLGLGLLSFVTGMWWKGTL